MRNRNFKIGKLMLSLYTNYYYNNNKNSVTNWDISFKSIPNIYINSSYDYDIELLDASYTNIGIEWLVYKINIGWKNAKY